jgi:hypothetical protein
LMMMKVMSVIPKRIGIICSSRRTIYRNMSVTSTRLPGSGA